MVHALVLTVVLVAVVAALGPGLGSTSDEGAAILQAELLEGGSWFYERPLPEVDPSGALSPVPLGEAGVDGFAFYAKHPLYPLSLQALIGPLGQKWLVLSSVLGTVVAALAAAGIARTIAARLVKPVFWAVGIASPLFFDATLVLAHAPAAATFGVAVLAAWRSTARSYWGAMALGSVSVLAVVVTALLRTEGVLAVGALAVALITVAISSRRVVPAVLGVAVGMSGALTWYLENRWTEHLIGARTARPGLSISRGANPFVAGRIESLWNDLFDPGITGRLSVGPLVVLAALGVLVLVGGALRSGEATRVVALLAAVVVLYGLRLVAAPLELFGLFAAFPMLWLGLLALRRRRIATDPRRFLVVIVVVFTAALFATNYAVGGSIQWGGRYLALMLPLAVPLAVDAIWSRLDDARFDATARRRVGALLCALGLLTSLTAVRTVRVRHEAVSSLTSALAHAAEVAGPSGTGLMPDRPVALAYNRLVPQLLYGSFDELVWLGPDRRDDTGPDAARALKDAGVDRVVVHGAPADLPGWEDWYEVERVPSLQGDVIVLARCPGGSEGDDACDLSDGP